MKPVSSVLSPRPGRIGQVLALLLACEAGPGAPPPPPDPAPAAPDPPPPLADAVALTIRERPLTDDDARRRRTIAYRQRHQDPAIEGVTIAPRMIVLHHTGGGDLDATWRYFERPTLAPGRPEVASGGDLNVGAHFLIDRDGAIVRLMPETRMARHCIGLNHLAIGVENVGDGDAWPLTDAQLAANVALVRDLKRRFPAITHLIGHHESLAFADHPLFREREPAYRLPQEDPGPAFMRAVRARLTDLDLAGPP